MKSLIQLNGIYKRFGSKVIFDNASVSIYEGRKIGVIGRNGAGKSTMFRIITGLEEADSGDVIKSQDLALSYLEQKDPFLDGEKVLDFLMRYTGQESWRCGKIAGSFQLKGQVLESRIQDLSGGFRMRVKLTAMLLKDPNFLMLDEPTNYLDLRTLILLETFLRKWNGGFLIISHDREFLMRTCEETMEVDREKISTFPGNVEEYMAYRESEKELALRQNRNIEQKQKELEAFIVRFRAKASKASQAQSKQKQLDRLQTTHIGMPGRKARIRLPDVQTHRGLAIRAEVLKIGYGEKAVASKIEFQTERGARIAVLGDNGQGKSTLLKTLAGELAPLAGKIHRGGGLRLSYYAQHVYTSIDENMEAFDYFRSRAPDHVTNQEILNLAGGLLFRDDDVKKPVRVLSGGERARLALGGVLLSGAEILLLDEPTNHLDFETVEELGLALREFKGTIFFVSHDRTFVNMVATQILEVKDGEVLHYPGTYEEYVFRMELDAEKESENEASEENSSEKNREKKAYHIRKETQSELTRLKTAIKKIEDEISSLEKDRQSLMREMEAGAYSREKSDRLTSLTADLEDKESRWASMEEERARLEKELERT